MLIYSKSSFVAPAIRLIKHNRLDKIPSKILISILYKIGFRKTGGENPLERVENDIPLPFVELHSTQDGEFREPIEDFRFTTLYKPKMMPIHDNTLGDIHMGPCETNRIIDMRVHQRAGPGHTVFYEFIGNKGNMFEPRIQLKQKHLVLAKRQRLVKEKPRSP